MGCSAMKKLAYWHRLDTTLTIPDHAEFDSSHNSSRFVDMDIDSVVYYWSRAAVAAWLSSSADNSDSNRLSE